MRFLRRDVRPTSTLSFILTAMLSVGLHWAPPAAHAGFEPVRGGCCGDGYGLDGNPSSPTGAGYCYGPPAPETSPVTTTWGGGTDTDAQPCAQFYAYHTGGHSRSCHRCSNVANYECREDTGGSLATAVLSLNVPNVPRAYNQVLSQNTDALNSAKAFSEKNQMVMFGGPIELTGGSATSKSSVESFALGDYSLFPHVHPITDYVHEIGTPVLFQQSGTDWKPVISQVVDKPANVIRAEIGNEGNYQIFGAQFELIEDLRLGNATIDPAILEKDEGANVTIEVGTPTASIRIRILNAQDQVMYEKEIDTSDLAGRPERRVPVTIPLAAGLLPAGDYRGIISTPRASGPDIDRFFVFKVMGQSGGTDPGANTSAAPPLAFGSVVAYPNPAKGGQSPTISIEVEQPDKLMLRIYDSAGGLAFETQVSDPEKAVADKQIYRVALDSKNFKSGIYYGVVTAQRSGQEAVRKKFSFTIVK